MDNSFSLFAGLLRVDRSVDEVGRRQVLVLRVRSVD